MSEYKTEKYILLVMAVEATMAYQDVPLAKACKIQKTNVQEYRAAKEKMENDEKKYREMRKRTISAISVNASKEKYEER